MEKPFLTIAEQLTLLKQRGLQFRSEDEVMTVLRRRGYYEIINGYKQPFLIDPHNDNVGFHKDTTFSEIYQLFILDDTLRAHVMRALIAFEATLRQAISFVVASEISADYQVYSQRHFYHLGRRRHRSGTPRTQYPIDALRSTFESISQTRKNPANHYQHIHHNLPPWIMVKHLTFGNLIWWYKLLKHPHKQLVVALMFNTVPTLQGTQARYENWFSQILPILLDLRNAAAHGNRIYAFKPKLHLLAYDPYFHSLLGISPAAYRQGAGRGSLGDIAKILTMFENPLPANLLINGFHDDLHAYLDLNPTRQTYLEDTIGLSLDWLDIHAHPFSPFST